MACDADLTIESALRDPLIAAVMRADRVDPKSFETLLTSTRRRLGGPSPRVPMAIAARCRDLATRCGHAAR